MADKRVPKFRVWDKVDNKIHYLLTDINWECEVAGVQIKIPTAFSASEKIVRKDIPFENCELILFSKLCDKNGRPICDGDIAKTYFADTEVIGRVEYRDDGFVIIFPEPIGDASLRYYYRDIEVIGNVYEHPHLLEVPNNG